MKKANNINGIEINFDAALHLMDSEIMEEMDGMFELGQEQEYIEEYDKRHAAKFDGEEFAPYYGLAW